MQSVLAYCLDHAAGIPLGERAQHAHGGRLLVVQARKGEPIQWGRIKSLPELIIPALQSIVLSGVQQTVHLLGQQMHANLPSSQQIEKLTLETSSPSSFR